MRGDRVQHALAQCQCRAIQQAKCTPDASFGHVRGLPDFGFVRVAARRLSKRTHDVIGFEWPQQETSAARANGWQLATGSMADEQEQRAFRRLFQHFQQCVGTFALEIVDSIDDGDSPAALARGGAEKGNRPANVVHADHGIEFAGLLIDAALEHQQVVLRLRSDAACNRVAGIHRERRRLLDLR